MPDVSLSARGVVKRYGGVVALADGNLEVQTGSVVALLGANGSGKSTLTKIITGVVAPNAGQLLLDGHEVKFASPKAAQNHGITAVYQELSLVPDMTVSENIWMGREPMLGFSLNRFKLHQKTQALLDLFKDSCSSNFRPEVFVNSLTPDEQQIVEILKALSQNPRILIFDEATASLDAKQVNRLFELIGKWKKRMGIVFVSHRMDEIFRIADTATVLRNGKLQGSRNITETDEAELVELMIEGASNPERVELPPVPDDASLRLQVTGLKSQKLKGIDLTLRDGELLGIGGLQGQGQADLLLSLFGGIPFEGRVVVSGKDVHFYHPRQAMANGLAFVPGDRKAEGLLLSRSILENFHLPSWAKFGFPLRIDDAEAEASRMGEELKLKMSGLAAPVSSLSGGNAQKVVIGKWLLRDAKLLLLNDPTKGVDVGAKGEFYNLLAELRSRGTAILFYSSDDEELLGLCDRVLVLHDGHISAELHGDALTRANLVGASMGTA